MTGSWLCTCAHVFRISALFLQAGTKVLHRVRGSSLFLWGTLSEPTTPIIVGSIGDLVHPRGHFLLRIKQTTKHLTQSLQKHPKLHEDLPLSYFSHIQLHDSTKVDSLRDSSQGTTCVCNSDRRLYKHLVWNIDTLARTRDIYHQPSAQSSRNTCMMHKYSTWIHALLWTIIAHDRCGGRK